MGTCKLIHSDARSDKTRLRSRLIIVRKKFYTSLQLPQTVQNNPPPRLNLRLHSRLTLSNFSSVKRLLSSNMPTQPEQVLEDNLVSQLANLGYEKVQVTDEESMLANLKAQGRFLTEEL